MAKAATAKKAPAETAEQAADRPLLDLNNDAVKKMIRAAKKRGYVTVDELNAVMPSEEVSPDQIEDTMSMLSDMGINVVEEEEESDEGPAAGEGESASTEVATTGGTAVATTRKKEPKKIVDTPSSSLNFWLDRLRVADHET